jgi:hypothetical protein
VKYKEGRRNRYAIQAHLPLPDSLARQRTIGEVLGLLTDLKIERDGIDPPAAGSRGDRASHEQSHLPRNTPTS